MKKYRHIFGHFPSYCKEVGEKLGLNQSLVGVRNIHLTEDSQEYLELIKFLKSHHIEFTDKLSQILFSPVEIENAFTIAISTLPMRSIGYPKPEEDFGYMNKVYLNPCPKCGIHEGQVAPFSIQNIPKFSKSFNWFTIGWVYDAVFVNKDWYDRTLSRFNIQTWPVVNYKSNLIIKNIVQLKLPVIDKDIMDHFKQWPMEMCSECNRKKPIPKVLDYFAQVEFNKHMAMTNVFFGSGKSAQQKIVISKEIMDVLLAEKFITLNHIWPSRPLES